MNNNSSSHTQRYPDGNTLPFDGGSRLPGLGIARRGFIDSNHAAMAVKSGSFYNKELDRVESYYMERPYAVCCKTAKITPLDNGRALNAIEHVVFLHYLTEASGEPLSGNLVSCQDLPQGNVFFPAFKISCIDAFAKEFGDDPLRLYTVLEHGVFRKSKFGDASIEARILPNVPLVFVVWGKDDEFPANATVMYDTSVSSYLNMEDIICCGGFVLDELINLAREK